mgnify:CR=1 FL=1
MNQAEFEAKLETINSKPKEVLKPFLQGQKDPEIAAKLHCTRANVARHLSNVANHFELRMAAGERCREELIDLFVEFQPDWVCEALKIRHQLSPSLLTKVGIPEGPISFDSRFCVKREPCEADACAEIIKPGALVRLKAPEKMGKSSLANRIADYAEQRGYVIARLNMQSVSTQALSDLDLFLRWLCSSIEDELELAQDADEYWDRASGTSNRKCERYLKRYILKVLDTPLVLCLDNVDRLFPHPEIATDFFGLLRAWFEQAKANALWEKLRMLITYSSNVYVQIDCNRSPFNVGFQVELLPFTPEQVGTLVKQHGLQWPLAEIQGLMALTGGHPYLVRMALYHAVHDPLSFDELAALTPTEAGFFREHLRDRFHSVQSNPPLQAAVNDMLTAKGGAVRVESDVAFKLHSMGLVRRQANDVVFLCGLYQQYFSDRLENSTK